MDLSSKLIITTLSICAAAWAVMNAILVKKLIEAERCLDQLETRISLLANSDSHDRKRLMDKARALNTPSGRRRAKQRSGAILSDMAERKRLASIRASNQRGYESAANQENPRAGVPRSYGQE